MVSPRTFPFARPRNSTKQKTKKGTRLPPPLKLEDSFLRAQVEKDISLAGPLLIAVRGSISEPTGNTENKGHTELEEVPVNMEVSLAQPPQAEEEPAECPEPPAEPLEIPTPETTNHQRDGSTDLSSKRSTLERSTSTFTQPRPVSPQESLRTIICLDTPNASDDEESDISPLSDQLPLTASRPGAALRRFFPELSSNHFSLVSPMGTGADDRNTRPEYQSISETELYERVHTLYKNSADAVESPSGEVDRALEQKTGSSSGSGSDGIFDCASSCYSRRTSITSVGTECVNPATNACEVYSIISPVTAGVFDDAGSLCPSRTSSFASRVPSTKAPPSAYPASSLYPPSSIQLSRRISVASKLSLNDLKNKPLPLEPVQEPSPLAIRRNDYAPVSASTEISRSTGFHSTYRHPKKQHSATTLNRKQFGQACQTCGGCGGNSGNSSRGRRGRPSEWMEATNGQRLRHIPTLEQAAEELEYALADLAKDPHMKQRTLLVRDATSTTAPSTKPHSKSHPSKPFKKSKSIHTKVKPTENALKPQSGTLKSKHTTKDKSPPLPDKDHLSNKDEAKDKTTPKPPKSPKTPTAPELKEERRPAGGSNSKPTEDTKKLKMKMSFNLSMPSFKRTHHSRATTLQDPRLSVVLSSRSEASLPDPPHTPGQTRPDAASRLSSHSDSSLELDAGAASKRDDLLLQLPRLQTQDLNLEDPVHLLNLSQNIITQPQQQQQQQGAAPSSCAPSPSPTHPQHQQTHPASSAATASGDAKVSTVELRITPPEDGKILVASERMRHTRAFVPTAQASSVQLPSEQIYELAATPPSPSSVMQAIFAERDQVRVDSPVDFPVNFSVDFPVEMPEHLVILIMERIDSLDDLFNFVLVSKRFYQIFKRRELSFIKSALFRMSPPAWELREMSPPWVTEWQLLLEPDAPLPEYTPGLYLDRYARDIYTLAQLKSMILVRCSPFLRRDTVKGLSGVDHLRAEEVDDAFWRIWTFCRIFGSGKGRENDLEGQMDWLKGGPKARSSVGALPTMTEPFGMNNVLFEPPQGFARGNTLAGLSAKQLYDMTEIWTCLGVLLQPLHGQCVEARKAGIYRGLDVPEGDAVREEIVLGKWSSDRQPMEVDRLTHLLFTEEWTAYVLTLGLSAALALSSLCPAEATAATFNKAQSAGLTKWVPAETESSRSSFLKEAVSRVYEEQERSLSSSSPHEPHLERRKQFQEELRTRRLRSGPSCEGAPGISFAEERPMSEFSTIVHDLDGATPRDASPVPPLPPVPSLTFNRRSSSTASAGPRTPARTPPRSLTPESILPIPRSPPFEAALLPPPLRPQVQDPVDRALAHMVNELGFDPDDVKWALKITDTGEGIDVEAAEQLLKHQKRKNEQNPFAPRGKDSLLRSVMKRQGSQDSGWRWA
ncbi:uncharacterized protein N7482_005120 [Penicillium canariense]|uniref:F-box domain-containing protein n=1 Tax=Penicillium canariense TaxID=189055 RepID=A0A9W9I4D0_9EURO|nr:uncharacterized protein N7482_005120 [Penicillium canariense]KAJ5166339.1 hypothetical protein N7482_005120 [Penicillium canariense]